MELEPAAGTQPFAVVAPQNFPADAYRRDAGLSQFPQCRVTHNCSIASTHLEVTCGDPLDTRHREAWDEGLLQSSGAAFRVIPTEEAAAGMELRNLLDDEQFLARTPRCRNSRNDLNAMRRLALVFAETQDVILQELVTAAVAFTEADSAGISLLEAADGSAPQFRWVAVAGSFAKYVHGTAPRFFSPCGTCLDRKKPQLYRVTKPYYDYLGIEADPIQEGILIPWENDQHRGTFWAVSHDSAAAFDVNDYNLLMALTDFASVAIGHQIRETYLRSQEKNAASAAMANDLAHQINNPLQGLTNALYLAQQGGDESSQYVQQAAGELAHVTALVGRLLSLNRQ